MLVNNKGVINRKVLYSKAVYGLKEKLAVWRSMDNGWLASGPLVAKFEKEVASLFGKKYGIAVNSGSSANLLAIASLKLPPGSEVITPACTFSTVVSAIVLNGLKPVFVDSIVGRYTINEDLIEKAICQKTKAIMVPQLIGGVCDMPRLRLLAAKYDLILIDDSCDTLAPSYLGTPVAKFSDVTTTSFYGSHIITALGFGGMILTDSKGYRDRVITMRDWGRVGDDSEPFENRFDFKIDKIPYDRKFLYSEFGFNLKMNEAAAAFGLVQLKRLPKFLGKRQENFNMLYEFFKGYEKDFHLPVLSPGYDTNWLAFPLTVKKTAKFKRYEFIKFLESRGIQIRVLFSGNILRHPVYRGKKYKQIGKVKNADHIMASGFLIGCHQGIGKKEIDYIKQVVKEFYENRRR